MYSSLVMFVKYVIDGYFKNLISGYSIRSKIKFKFGMLINFLIIIYLWVGMFWYLLVNSNVMLVMVFSFLI